MNDDSVESFRGYYYRVVSLYAVESTVSNDGELFLRRAPLLRMSNVFIA